MMTKDEFKMELWHYGQEQRCLGGEMSFEQRGIAVKSAGAIRKALLDTYDAMAARIRDLEEQIAEHAAYSHEIATLAEARERIKELEAKVAAMDREMMSMAATSDGFQMDAMFARERIAALVLRVILDSRVVLHRGAIQRAHDLLDGGEG